MVEGSNENEKIWGIEKVKGDWDENFDQEF